MADNYNSNNYSYVNPSTLFVRTRTISRRDIPYGRREESPAESPIMVSEITGFQEIELLNTSTLSMSLKELRYHRLSARAAVEAMEKIRYGGCVDESEGDTCPICMNELVAGVELTRTPCSHVFHYDCLVNWVEKSYTCPMCRFKLPNN